ncbi:MAG: DUF2232 domain-containing protein [Oscillospiraceae bacterium]
MSHSLRLAFSSMITAIGTAIMFLTGLIPIGTYALPALAGIFLIPVVIEIGINWAFGIFIAESLLSGFFAPDKEAALCFILFFGYYPVLKAVLERKLQKRWMCAIAKYLLFNIALILDFWATVAILKIPIETFSVFGAFIPVLFLLAGNVMFFLYDYALSLLVISYCNKLRHALQKWFHIR